MTHCNIVLFLFLLLLLVLESNQFLSARISFDRSFTPLRKRKFVIKYTKNACHPVMTKRTHLPSARFLTEQRLRFQNEAMRRQSGAGERVMSPVYAADRVLPWATG
ncbi:MAG: hypothetical protein ACYC7E_23535, partial [Armatimonadota bacterium]